VKEGYYLLEHNAMQFVESHDVSEEHNASIFMVEEARNQIQSKWQAELPRLILRS
jgi:hypothetical protein